MSKKLTLTAIKRQLADEHVSTVFIAELKKDERKGVHQLLAAYQRKQEKLQEQKQKFAQMFQFEKLQYQQGKRLIAGIDEAGRGPLAGPVVAAAVILKEDFYLAGLNDSKQLSAKIREQYFQTITEEAVSYGVGIVHSEEIDQLNIYQATKKAMRLAVDNMAIAPEHLLIDAVPLHDFPCSTESITKGDQKSVSIAAASIIAKVTRDQIMQDIHHLYPAYEFSSNMGYGTKVHLEALRTQGASPYHRRSFAPVKDIIAMD